MKHFARYFVPLLFLNPGLSGSALASTTTLEISALIDGRDQLIIQGNTLQWHHFDYAAVGRINGLNESTVITTTLDGFPVIDHAAWIPDWSAPPPNEIRFETFSSVFMGLTPAITSDDTFVTLKAVSARWNLHLVQLPTSNNAFTTILEFNDNIPGGPAQYDALLTFQTPVPEPSTTTLLTAGGVFLLGRELRRRLRAKTTSPL